MQRKVSGQLCKTECSSTVSALTKMCCLLQRSINHISLILHKFDTHISCVSRNLRQHSSSKNKFPFFFSQTTEYRSLLKWNFHKKSSHNRLFEPQNTKMLVYCFNSWSVWILEQASATQEYSFIGNSMYHRSLELLTDFAKEKSCVIIDFAVAVLIQKVWGWAAAEKELFNFWFKSQAKLTCCL